MAAYDMTDAQSVSAGYTRRIAQTFATLVAVVSDWNDTRLTRKSLAELSAHELYDIGLERGDIDTVSRRTYY